MLSLGNSWQIKDDIQWYYNFVWIGLSVFSLIGILAIHWLILVGSVRINQGSEVVSTDSSIGHRNFARRFHISSYLHGPDWQGCDHGKANLAKEETRWL